MQKGNLSELKDFMAKLGLDTNEDNKDILKDMLYNGISNPLVSKEMVMANISTIAMQKKFFDKKEKFLIMSCAVYLMCIDDTYGLSAVLNNKIKELAAYDDHSAPDKKMIVMKHSLTLFSVSLSKLDKLNKLVINKHKSEQKDSSAKDQIDILIPTYIEILRKGVFSRYFKILSQSKRLTDKEDFFAIISKKMNYRMNITDSKGFRERLHSLICLVHLYDKLKNENDKFTTAIEDKNWQKSVNNYFEFSKEMMMFKYITQFCGANLMQLEHRDNEIDQLLEQYREVLHVHSFDLLIGLLNIDENVLVNANEYSELVISAITKVFDNIKNSKKKVKNEAFLGVNFLTSFNYVGIERGQKSKGSNNKLGLYIKYEEILLSYNIAGLNPVLLAADGFISKENIEEVVHTYLVSKDKQHVLTQLLSKNAETCVITNDSATLLAETIIHLKKILLQTFLLNAVGAIPYHAKESIKQLTQQSTSKDANAEAIITENFKLKKEVDQLRSLLRTSNLEKHNLQEISKNTLQEKDYEIAELRFDLETKSRLEELKREGIYVIKEGSRKQDSTVIEYERNYLEEIKDLNIVVIGGFPLYHHNLKQTINEKKLKCIESRNYNTPVTIVDKADVIVLVGTHNNHSQYHRYLKYIKNRGLKNRTLYANSQPAGPLLARNIIQMMEKRNLIDIEKEG